VEMGFGFHQHLLEFPRAVVDEQKVGIGIGMGIVTGIAGEA
jgi:hypothetical protein